MRYYVSILSLILSALYNNSSAQLASISGKVADAGKGLFATVSLLNAQDSSWIRSEVTDDNGLFSIKNITQGNYLVTANALGYKNGTQKIEVRDNKKYDCPMPLIKDSVTLNEVSVSAKKPFIEMSMGKTTVNIEGSATTAGANLLELMRRLPGVTVDLNGTISMNGKQGVLVLIDDRQTYLSGDDLADYLKTISADEIGQIELITQSSAKYDAAGNTGVINVNLKKNKKQGWNGNITLAYGNGIYFHRNENLLLSYKKNKLSLSLNVSDMEAIGFADWTEQLYYKDAQTENITSGSYFHSTPKERFSNTALRVTADYDLTEKTTIGTNISTTYHPNTNNIFIAATNTDLSNNNITYNQIASPDGFIRKNVAANAYITHKFSKESTLDINIDALSFNKSSHQDITNTTYNDQMQPLVDPLISSNHQLLDINVYSAKADYTNTFKNKVKLETGVKRSLVNTDYNPAFLLYSNNSWINDTGSSNRFVYKENINAAYVALSRNLGPKWETHIGLRAEQTNATGLQYVHNVSFSKNYISAFPTAYITYKKDTDNQFELNYGRRIERPSYNQLNPFTYYSFQNTYQVGNPYLQPQYTNNIELKHSYKNMLISTLTFSNVTNVLSDMLQANDSAKVVYDVDQNWGSNNYISYAIIFNKDIKKWWTLNAGGSTFYATMKGIVLNKEQRVQWNGYSVHLNTQFSFGKGWKMEAYAYYNSKGRSSLTSTFDANMYMEFGASKKVNEKILLKCSAYDPFYLCRYGIHNDAPDLKSDIQYRYASRLFSLSATCNFGSNKAGEQKTHSLEEEQRIK